MEDTSRSPLYIVGRGAATSFGQGHATFLDAVFRGESGIRPLERLEGTDCLTGVAAEVPASIRESVPRYEDLPFALAYAAASEAREDWRRVAGDAPARDILLVLASTKADMTGIVTPEGDGLGSPYRLAKRLSAELGSIGLTAAVSCACASGLAALALAGRELRAGTAKHALVVGTDSLSPFILRGFSSLLALAPERCRPFDRDRRGLSLGEGAGAMILSRDPQGGCGVELAGWGESNDANHITGPSRDGAGLALAITRALHHADTQPSAIDYVHLHGTGTPYNDAMESKALARVFATAPDATARDATARDATAPDATALGARVPAASGSKAQIGHTLGAAGILESMVAAEAILRGIAPPNLGLENLDEDSPIDLPRSIVSLGEPRAALKLAAGFGGINAALILRRSG